MSVKDNVSQLDVILEAIRYIASLQVIQCTSECSDCKLNFKKNGWGESTVFPIPIEFLNKPRFFLYQKKQGQKFVDIETEKSMVWTLVILLVQGRLADKIEAGQVVPFLLPAKEVEVQVDGAT